MCIYDTILFYMISVEKAKKFILKNSDLEKESNDLINRIKEKEVTLIKQ